MTLRYDVAIGVLVGTLAIALLTVGTLRGALARYTLSAAIAGLCVYNGLGAAYAGMPSYYVVYYFVFAVGFCLSFVLVYKISGPLGRMSERGLSRALRDVDRQRIWILIWVAYVMLHFVPLLYPRWRIHELLAPPAPRSFTASGGGEAEQSGLLALISYSKLLISPFFYLAIYRLREKPAVIGCLFLLSLYAEYVTYAYIGRGPVLVALGVVFLGLWMHRPDLRVRLAVLLIAMAPIIVTAAHAYASLRLGRAVGELSVSEAARTVFEKETSFPVRAGRTVIESGTHARMLDYVAWIVTLPVPKVLTGEIEGARINTEISELVLGIRRGEKGFHGVMAGLVAEGVYIYGRLYYWLHAVMVGAVAAIIVRLISGTRQATFLAAYVVILFGYQLNRGGVSSVLPVVVNEFMALYVGLAFLTLFWYSERNPLRRRRTAAFVSGTAGLDRTRIGIGAVSMAGNHTNVSSQ